MTETTTTQDPPLLGLSTGAIQAAMEIARKVSAVSIYAQALGESFAVIIDRHTRAQELLIACKLAREALEELPASTTAAQRHRTRAIETLEKVIAAVK